MKFRKILGLLVLSLLLTVVTVACGGAEGGQEYPDRDITLMVPYEPGGSSDPIARQYAEQLEAILGVSVVVENRAGGGGTIGTNAVVEAEPDGYTIGLSLNSPLALQPLNNPELSYSSTEDYQPIFELSQLPLVIAVRDDAPWQTLEEFLDDARENPGQRQVSTGSAGGTRDLQIAELNRGADLEIGTVPFSGGGSEAITALQGGRVDAVCVTAPGLAGPVEAGDLRVLGTFTEEQYEFFPEATPILEAGYDVRSLEDRYPVIAPKGLPEDVLNTLVESSREAATSEEFSQFLEENGHLADPKGPEELAAELEEDKETYVELLESS